MEGVHQNNHEGCIQKTSMIHVHQTKIPWREYTENIIQQNSMEGVQRERERNVLFNDALNTFYLRLYGVRHMVKDHFDSEKRNPLPPHWLLLSISSKGSFICNIPQT